MRAKDRAGKTWNKEAQDHLFQAALETVGAMEIQRQALVDAIVRGAPPFAGKPCQCGCAPCLKDETRLICVSCQSRASMQLIVTEYHLAMNATMAPRRKHRRTQQQPGPCTGDPGSALEPKLDPDPARGSNPSFSPDRATTN
jgi:hypothetical protein